MKSRRHLLIAGLLAVAAALALPWACEAEKLRLIEEAEAASGQRALGPGDYERYLVQGERGRRYELHVPPGYDGKTAVPLVLNFHGGGGRVRAARRGTRMDAKADEAGFIVCYPEGTGRFRTRLLTFNGGRCCGYAAANAIDDVGFTEQILDDVAARFRIDPRRVYATGLSNGAIMSYRLACELPDRIAAIAPVAGPLEYERCNPSRPVPVLHIHGTADQNAPYAGGVGERSWSKTDFRSVESTVRAWLAFNGCAPEPVSTETRGPASIQRWKGDSTRSEVVLVTIERGGHVWPGGKNLLPRFIVGEDVGGVDANELIWDFFSRHRLP